MQKSASLAECARCILIRNPPSAIEKYMQAQAVSLVNDNDGEDALAAASHDAWQTRESFCAHTRELLGRRILTREHA